MMVMDNLRCRLSRWFLPSRLRSPEAIPLSELSPSRTAEDFSTENSPPASCDRLIGQCFRIALALGVTLNDLADYMIEGSNDN
jgi:hypothetical protein